MKAYIIGLCEKLNLKKISSFDSIYLYETYKDIKENQYKEDTILMTAILISVKYNEELTRVRDIINVVLFDKKRVLNEDENKKKKYNSLLYDKTLNENEKTQIIVKTMYSLSINNYNIIKSELLDSEMFLLKNLNYNFKSENKSSYAISIFIQSCERVFFNKEMVKLSIEILFKLYESEDIQIIFLNQNIIYFTIGIMMVINSIELTLNGKNKENQLISKNIKEFKKPQKIIKERLEKIIKLILNHLN